VGFVLRPEAIDLPMIISVGPLIALLALSLAPIDGFAHGEDKSGPHGGYIRMPGAFHIEIVLPRKNTLRVYLSDMEWKNPTIEKSSVSVMFVKDDTSKTLNCKAKKEYFECVVALPGVSHDVGELKVRATRKGSSGAEVRYKLPLILEP